MGKKQRENLNVSHTLLQKNLKPNNYLYKKLQDVQHRHDEGFNKEQEHSFHLPFSLKRTPIGPDLRVNRKSLSVLISQGRLNKDSEAEL